MRFAQHFPLRLDSTTRHMATLRVPVDALAESLTIVLRRPTTESPLAWDVTSQLQVTLTFASDGYPYCCLGRVSGGVRLDGKKKELSEYRLTYYLPILRHEGVLKRIGELGVGHVASIDIELLRGNVETEIVFVETASAPLQNEPYHNSVAFGAATSAIELGGDGVISFSHTASGSDRAAFIGMASELADNTPGTHSATYAGNAATSIWTAIGPFTSQRYSGLRVLEANVPTGSQTVTATVTEAIPPGTFGAGVMTLTGVNQTTSVGTAVTASGPSGTTTPSVTVGSVGSDDLVVDVCFAFVASGGLTAGADQTDRWAQQTSTVCFSGSTQAGTAGGVMSYTKNINNEYMIGAVAFKPSAAAPPAVVVALLPSRHQRMFRGMGR